MSDSIKYADFQQWGYEKRIDDFVKGLHKELMDKEQYGQVAWMFARLKFHVNLFERELEKFKTMPEAPTTEQ